MKCKSLTKACLASDLLDHKNANGPVTSCPAAAFTLSAVWLTKMVQGQTHRNNKSEANGPFICGYSCSSTPTKNHQKAISTTDAGGRTGRNETASRPTGIGDVR